MALTFYWRCEAAALNGTHDYSAGATTMTANSTVALSATAVKVGTNGIEAAAGATNKYYYCAPTSIFDYNDGTIAGWVNFQTAIPAAGTRSLMGAFEAADTNNDYIQFRSASSSELSLSIRKEGGTIISKTTTSANLVPGDWYFVVGSWRLADDKLRIRVYDSTGALVEEINNDTDLTDLSTGIPIAADRLYFGGGPGTNANAVWVDNVFVGSSYDDADVFLLNRDITSYSSYATGTKYVRLLTEASAASAANIEGVVLNSTRDTVIGEFSSQTFEAALVSGEAELLIDVADITPNGSTLTTADTPIVFAYNATYSTVGPGSATVIEV